MEELSEKKKQKLDKLKEKYKEEKSSFLFFKMLLFNRYNFQNYPHYIKVINDF